MVSKLLKCTKLNQLEAEIFHIRLLTKEKVCKSRLLLCEKLSQEMQICQKSSADRFFFLLLSTTVKKDLGRTYVSCTALCWPLLLASKTLPQTPFPPGGCVFLYEHMPGLGISKTKTFIIFPTLISTCVFLLPFLLPVTVLIRHLSECKKVKELK